MFLKICFVLYYVALEFASAASTYDQSQTGNLNVQIDLKDLQIIALTKNTKEEYVVSKVFCTMRSLNGRLIT